MSLSFVMWAMEAFQDENLGMAGMTIGSFRRNVITPLKRMLKFRGYKVKDHRTDNMLPITYKGVTNYFYVFGGKDEGSQELIQGITLAGKFFDEVGLMRNRLSTKRLLVVRWMTRSSGSTATRKDLITGLKLNS